MHGMTAVYRRKGREYLQAKSALPTHGLSLTRQQSQRRGPITAVLTCIASVMPASCH